MNSSTTADLLSATAMTFAAQCASPRAGLNPSTAKPYADAAGSIESEKSWVRAWINDTYLWYSEVPNLSPTNYLTAVDYFAVLKTSALSASGAAKDKFHFTYATPEWRALSQAGVAMGYGIDWALLASRPPRSIVVSQVTPSSVAAATGLQRGAVVLTVDGVDAVNSGEVAAINAGLFPAVAGQAHIFTVKDPGASTARQITLTAGPVTLIPVQNVKLVGPTDSAVGYLLFNDHIATAEAQLIAAIAQLKAAKVTDLVLDMRYNGGGYLDIAAELAYMIAGPVATTGKTFERLVFNDKNPFNANALEVNTPFHAQSQGFSGLSGQSLPYLSLRRVFVLTTSRTCSASEAVVNGLRGAGIDVVLIGGTTCGKPYGFLPQDNCGITYFAIQFQGVNEVGFGDYSDGFSPTCTVGDDYNHALGDPAEGQLAAALAYRTSGFCPVTGMTGVTARSASAKDGLALVLPANPVRSSRFWRRRAALSW